MITPRSPVTDGKNEQNIDTLRNAIVELAKLRQMVECDDAALQNHDAALGAASVLASTSDAVAIGATPRVPVSTDALRRQQNQQQLRRDRDSSEWDSALDDGYESEASAGAEEARAWSEEHAPVLPAIPPRAPALRVVCLVDTVPDH